eukprot:scaffold27377_cov61-Phaeocystis_antarctica.AAC.9
MAARCGGARQKRRRPAAPVPGQLAQPTTGAPLAAGSPRGRADALGARAAQGAPPPRAAGAPSKASPGPLARSHAGGRIRRRVGPRDSSCTRRRWPYGTQERPALRLAAFHEAFRELALVGLLPPFNFELAV